jgi:hypothetical protein
METRNEATAVGDRHWHRVLWRMSGCWRGIVPVAGAMSYFHWLGKDAEPIMREQEESAFFRNEVIARQAECKPDVERKRS